MTEAYAQILPNSTGDKVRVVRNLIAGQLIDQQVVSIANERGALMPTDELLTAFGAQRVAPPLTLFDSKFLYDKQPLFWVEGLTGAGTSVQGSAMVTLGVTGGTDSVVRQSRQWFNYESGKSQLIMLTGVVAQEANVTKRVGYFNGVDGIYLKVTGADITWDIIRAGGVVESATQAAWNLDPLTGSGPSGVTLDLTVAQLLIIDFQWLGVGRVRVGFVIAGRIIYCHAFDHANVATVIAPYMNNPNLPVRYDITSTGGAGTLRQICSVVISEGGNEERGLVFSVTMGVTPLTLPANGVVALMAFRLAANRLGASIRAIAVELMTLTTGSLHWQLMLNPTISGTGLTYAPIGSSSLEAAFGAPTNLCTGGEHLDSGYVSNATRVSDNLIESALRLGSDLGGVSDVLVLGVVNAASTPNVLGTVTFREQL